MSNVNYWHEEAELIDYGAGGWPFVNIRIVYSEHQKHWVSVTNGVYRDHDTRQRALAYISAVLLAMSTHVEPVREEPYRWSYDPVHAWQDRNYKLSRKKEEEIT